MRKQTGLVSYENMLKVHREQKAVQQQNLNNLYSTITVSVKLALKMSEIVIYVIII